MVDGDKALVVQDDVIINVAKRDCEGVVPLYYEMLKAKDEPLTNEKIYTALTSAYKANIGIISNEITKIWNSNNPNVDAVKWLCCLNNFIIDFAKTLYMPNKPKHVEEELKKFSKMKLPYFFQYAKDKELKQVDELNDSTVNKLHSIIPDKSIQFKKVAGECDYTLLLRNKRIKENLNQDIIDKFKKINRIKTFIYRGGVGLEGFEQYLIEEISKINSNKEYVSDVLTYYMFNSNSKDKTTLWNCYGEIMYDNLLLNTEGTVCCEECVNRFEGKKNEKLCDTCKHEKIKESKRNWKKGRKS